MLNRHKCDTSTVTNFATNSFHSGQLYYVSVEVNKGNVMIQMHGSIIYLRNDKQKYSLMRRDRT